MILRHFTKTQHLRGGNANSSLVQEGVSKSGQECQHQKKDSDSHPHTSTHLRMTSIVSFLTLRRMEVRPCQTPDHQTLDGTDQRPRHSFSRLLPICSTPCLKDHQQNLAQRVGDYLQVHHCGTWEGGGRKPTEVSGRSPPHPGPAHGTYCGQSHLQQHLGSWLP